MSQNTSPKDKSSAYMAIAVGFGGILITIILRAVSLISEVTVAGLMALFLCVAIVVYALPRVQYVSLRKLEMRLSKVEQAEKRIYAREEVVKELTLTLADLALFETLNVGRVAERFGAGRIGEAIRQWRQKRIDKILNLVEANQEQKAYLMRYDPFFKPIEDAYNRLADQPEERRKIVVPEIEKLIAKLKSDA
jgi:hypothetical protein